MRYFLFAVVPSHLHPPRPWRHDTADTALEFRGQTHPKPPPKRTRNMFLVYIVTLPDPVWPASINLVSVKLPCLALPSPWTIGSYARLTPVVEVLVVLVDEVGRVLGVLRELLHDVPGEELAVGLLDAPVQLAHQLSRLGAVEEVHLDGSDDAR